MTPSCSSQRLHFCELARFNSPSLGARKLAGLSSDGSAPSIPPSSREVGDADKPCGDDFRERPAAVHQYKRSGSFGATCDLCRIGTVWDSDERVNPSPCDGAR